MEWLRGHKDNPYPNDDEKAMLIKQTGLTINQINYWFTNARRRILPKWAQCKWPSPFNTFERHTDFRILNSLPSEEFLVLHCFEYNLASQNQKLIIACCLLAKFLFMMTRRMVLIEQSKNKWHLSLCPWLGEGDPNTSALVCCGPHTLNCWLILAFYLISLWILLL